MMTKRTPAWRIAALGGIVCASLIFTGPARGEPDVLERPALESTRASKSVLLAVTRAGERLVAVGERGIILFSDDSGNTWRQAKVPVSVSLTNVRFAGTRKGWAVGHSGVVLHSEDGGETWVKQLDGRRAALLVLKAAKAAGGQDSEDAKRQLAEAERLAADGPDKPFLDVYFSDENNGLIVGAYGLVFSTQDGGKQWQSWISRIPNPKGKHLYSIQTAGRDLYIVGEQGAFYRSSDGGQTFAEIKTPYPGSYFGALAMAGGELVAYGLRGNAYWSGDAGKSWQKVETGQPVTLTAGVTLREGSVVLVDQDGNVLQSRDKGRTFRPLTVSRRFPFTGVAQAADGSLILSGTRGIIRIDVRSTAAEAKS